MKKQYRSKLLTVTKAPGTSSTGAFLFYTMALIKRNVSTFRLSNGLEFTVHHNLPQSGNINSISAAFDNWIVRTDEYTAESFVKYINDKGVHQAKVVDQKWNFA